MATAVPAAPRRVDTRLLALASCWVLLFAAANVGTILAPSLIDDHPGALMAMGSRNRVLLLSVGAGIAPLPFFLIGFVRLLLPALVLWGLGRHYGDKGRAWLAVQNGGDVPKSVATTERWFDRARYPVIAFFVGSNVVAVLAGSRQVAMRKYLPVLVLGVLVRLVFFWYLGIALKVPLEWVLGWIQRLQWPLTAVAVVVVVLQTRKVAVQNREVAEDILEDGVLDGPGEAG